MDEETKQKLKDAGLDGVAEAFDKVEEELKTEKEGRESDSEAHKTEIEKKDELISSKNNDLVGARKKYEKLEDMSAEKLAEMSEAEKSTLERQEQLEADQAAFKKQQEETSQKEMKSRIGKAIGSLVGEDAELKTKVEANYNRIKDSDTAITEDEISAIASTAFDMLGAAKPVPVANAVGNTNPGEAGSGAGDDFAETAGGKDLSAKMGLSMEAPKEAIPGDNGNAEGATATQ